MLDDSPSCPRTGDGRPVEGTFPSEGKGAVEIHAGGSSSCQGYPVFAHERGLDENKKGLIAPMPDLKIMVDAGHVAWDMERSLATDLRDRVERPLK